ncbi:RNA-binding protein [Phanerochaete sordida]|uniref:RNA-binding protein n=1 Tax=Phanerochaete sordida TaxID=48140 RepID=A0A9P3GUK0_9APHY|nr:RNA-binding protein [Phanerochaete sordida]
MAYNREWDKGKETWQDPSWAEYNVRANVRGREEDYYGEGKRRKYNDGGYTAPAGAGHDDSGYEIYTQGRHTNIWSDHGKKRQGPSEASPHVIFLGLDPDFNEADLQAYLVGKKCPPETVTIIRDRTTGHSRGFGFAQFTSIDHARAFVDPLFPFVDLPPPAAHGASARTAWQRALESGQQHNGRRAKIDYSQSASPAGRRPAQTNDGTRDIGNTQGPVLLFRGLDPLSGPQAIAQAMKLSSGPGKEGAKGMKRIILIKDKVTMASWGFAFVEFIDVQSAAAVLGATMSAQLHPSGFRISERPVAASFAHPESFQPISDFAIRDDACLASSLSLGGVEGTWVRYWDEGSTIAMLEFKVDPPVQPAAEQAKEKKKKSKVDKPIDNKPAEASELPLSDKPVTLSFKGAFGQKTALTAPAASVAAKKPAPAALGFSLNDEEGGEDEDEAADKNNASSDDKVAVGKKSVAPMVASKKTANNITKWNQVQEELKEGHEPVAGPSIAPVVVAPPTVVPVKPKDKSTTPAPADEFEFSDTNAKTCLLCARQFKSLDQLRRHNKESALHKKNYKDANLREVAREKAKAARAKAEAHQQPKYRDRASERRTIYNQPDIPLPDAAAGGAKGAIKKRHAEGPAPPPSPPPAPVAPAADTNNVGNKLLRMMGWKEGTGLGTDGEGRVEPIQTAIYAQGVGLGASKGKEVGKYAEGYTGYVQQAQEAARERYNS